MVNVLRKGDMATATQAANLKELQAGETIDAERLPAASTSEQGAMSAADKAKLDGIEAGADQTDFDSVSAAGAVMGDYFPDIIGAMIRLGPNAFSVLKHNLTATVAPTTDDDSTLDYAPGSMWIDTVGLALYFCVDATATAALWIDIASGSGGGGSGEPSTGDKGDVVVSGLGLIWTIDTNAVTYAKMQMVSATDKLLGRSSSGAGNIEEIACTAAGRALLDDADAAAQRLTLGLGALAVLSTIGAAQVTAGSLTNATLANMATQTIKGRTTAGSGAPEDLTATQATAILNPFVGDSGSGGTKGLVPAPGVGDASKFLKGDGTFDSIPGGGDALTSSPLSQFAATTSSQLAGVITDETGSGPLVFGTSPTLTTPTLGVATATTVNKVAITAPATGSTLTIANGVTLTAPATASVSGTNTGDQTITLTGDVTGSGTGSFAATVAADAITNAKLANVATGTLKGRSTAGTGDPEDLSAATAVALLGAEVTANKDIASGYAGLDARIQVPTARQRNRLFDLAVCSMKPSRASPGFRSEGFETPLATAGQMSTISDSAGDWTRLTCAGSSSGEMAGIAGPHFVYVQAQWLPEWTVKFRTGASIANVTWWVGLWSGAIASLSSPAGKSIAAFRFVAGSDTKWATYTCDGTASPTVTLDQSPSAVAANTVYELRVAVLASTVEFWIDGVRCATVHSTHLPVASTWMACGDTLVTSTAAARYQDINSAVLQHS